MSSNKLRNINLLKMMRMVIFLVISLPLINYKDKNSVYQLNVGEGTILLMKPKRTAEKTVGPVVK